MAGEGSSFGATMQLQAVGTVVRPEVMSDRFDEVNKRAGGSKNNGVMAAAVFFFLAGVSSSRQFQN